MMVTFEKISYSPPENFKPWRDLAEKWSNANTHSKQVQAVLDFYLIVLGNSKRLPGPPNNVTNGKATLLAKEFATVLAAYPRLREHFEKVIGTVEICCIPNPNGRAYDLIGDIVRFYPTNADLTQDEVLEMAVRIIGRIMYQDAPRQLKLQYDWWFTKEGKVHNRFSSAEDEVAYLVGLNCLKQELVWDRLQKESAGKINLKERRDWVENICVAHGL